MAVNKVTLKENNGEVRTLIDISSTTATAARVFEGDKFFDADGYEVEGSYVPTEQCTHKFKTKTVDCANTTKTYQAISDGADGYTSVTVNGAHISEYQIRKGDIVLGVLGEYDACFSPNGMSIKVTSDDNVAYGEAWILADDGAGFKQVAYHPDVSAADELQYSFAGKNLRENSEIWIYVHILAGSGVDSQFEDEDGGATCTEYYPTDSNSDVRYKMLRDNWFLFVISHVIPETNASLTLAFYD